MTSTIASVAKYWFGTQLKRWPSHQKNSGLVGNCLWRILRPRLFFVLGFHVPRALPMTLHQWAWAIEFLLTLQFIASLCLNPGVMYLAEVKSEVVIMLTWL